MASGSIDFADAVEFACRLGEVVLQQQRDVLAPLPERRGIDADDVQAVIQIFAKARFLDGAREVLVGGGDDADVDLDRLLPAHAVELAFCQHPQQARLQRGRHVADLIEKQRAAVRLFEAPDAARVGTGKRAFLMPEQFGLE